MKSHDVKQLRAAILSRLELGQPPSLIAQELGCARSTVYKVAASQDEGDRRHRNTGRPRLYGDEIWAVVLEARQYAGNLGPQQLYHRLVRDADRFGLDPTHIPRPSTIAAVVNKLGLAVKPVGPRDTRLYPDARPHSPGTLTVDLWGPWYIRATKLYLVTAQDRYTRLALAVPIYSNRSGTGLAAVQGLATAWARAIAASAKELLPTGLRLQRVYSDNGIGMVPTNGYLPMAARVGLASAGRVIYIPPGQPWRNGRLERFHLTLEKEFLRLQRPTSVDEADRQLAEWLNYYNADRPHGSLGYASPGEFASFTPTLAPGFWNVTLPDVRSPQPGTVEAIRLVANDGTVELWQNDRLRVSPLLGGQFVRVQFDVTGTEATGTVVYHRKTDDYIDVATFRHTLDQQGRAPGSPIIVSVLTSQLGESDVRRNERLDEEQLEKQLSRILKRRRRERDRNREEAAKSPSLPLT